jgi:predicted O-methyltransferase YrrM
MTEEQIKHLNELVAKTTKRAQSYAIMLSHVANIQNPLIVETGCARKEDNFDGDGMSTVIFDTLVDYHGGDFYSVDINPDNVRFAEKNTKKARVFCGDSVAYLHNQNKTWVQQGRKIDLLYLDSFDFDINEPHPSSLHHILEMVAISPSLGPGTMICVDDNFLMERSDTGERFEIGKGGYVKQYMDAIHKERIYTGYQWVWKL